MHTKWPRLYKIATVLQNDHGDTSDINSYCVWVMNLRIRNFVNIWLLLLNIVIRTRRRSTALYKRTAKSVTLFEGPDIFKIVVARMESTILTP